MKTIQVRGTDAMTVDGFTDDGDRIVVNARVARGGNVQTYLGAEFGMPDRKIVRVYRPEDEVFDRDSMATFPHKFVTLTHPKGKADFASDAVGWIGDEVARDGEFIRVPMTIAHKKAVDAVKSGVQQLSVGYTMELRLEDGVSPKGEAYDAVMARIAVDHVAIVGQARGGAALRIGDWNSPDKEGKTMKTIFVDGITVEVADNADQIVTRHVAKLEKSAADAGAALTAATAAHDKAMAAKDAEIDALKAKVMTDAQLDALVRDRADLISRAKTLSPNVATDGKSADEVRRAVLADRGVNTDGKSADYVAARFDALTDSAVADPVRHALTHRPVGPVGDAAAAAEAHRKSVSDMNAWRTQQ